MYKSSIIQICKYIQIRNVLNKWNCQLSTIYIHIKGLCMANIIQLAACSSLDHWLLLNAVSYAWLYSITLSEGLNYKYSFLHFLKFAKKTKHWFNVSLQIAPFLLCAGPLTFYRRHHSHYRASKAINPSDRQDTNWAKKLFSSI